VKLRETLFSGALLATRLEIIIACYGEAHTGDSSGAPGATAAAGARVDVALRERR
jgi:hypothetical protein